MTDHQKNMERSEDSAAAFEYGIEAMARALLPHLREFYENPQNRAAFASWKAQQSKA